MAFISIKRYKKIYQLKVVYPYFLLLNRFTNNLLIYILRMSNAKIINMDGSLRCGSHSSETIKKLVDL